MKFNCAYDVRDKKLILAKQAIKKRQCTCICPYCFEHLAVKTDESGNSYFVHNTSSSAECDTMMLRLIAKRFFSLRQSIMLTMGTLVSENDKYVVHFNEHLGIPGCTEVLCKIVGAEANKRIGDIIPDITLYTDKGEVHIDFKLKGDTSEYKVSQYRHLGAIAIELDLSELLESDVISLNQVWFLLERVCANLEYRVLYQPLSDRQRQVLNECKGIEGLSDVATSECRVCTYFVASVRKKDGTNKVYCRHGLHSLDILGYKLDKVFSPFIEYDGVDDECLVDTDVICDKIGD